MTTKHEPLAKSRNNHIRLRILRKHRLIVFEKAFDKYIRGEVDASYVSYRAGKLKQVGG